MYGAEIVFLRDYAFQFLNSVGPSERVSDAHVEAPWQRLPSSMAEEPGLVHTAPPGAAARRCRRVETRPELEYLS